MSQTSFTLHTKNRGFTLVEVIIIAPILILTLGAFIVALVNMVGDTLASRDANALVQNTQTALDRIEQDARVATGFQSLTGAMVSPQGQDNNYAGTASFTASATNHLIMAVPATNKNPLDDTRQIVYYGGPTQPNPCGAAQSYNTPLTVTVIYYIYNNSLFRRTVVPSFTLTAGQSNTVCSTPWQQNSCSPGYTSAQCQTQDAKLLDDVSSMNLTYYSTPTSTTNLGAANAASASTVGVVLNTSK
jgi:Tfp pilus assembly protein PilE